MSPGRCARILTLVLKRAEVSCSSRLRYVRGAPRGKQGGEQSAVATTPVVCSLALVW